MSVSVIKNILSSFEPIGLKDINDVKLMDRVDTKFSFNFEDLESFLSSLKEDYQVLVIDESPISKYNSLYYDDKVLTAFNDHQRKKPNRFKVRFRKYVYSNIQFLEVKHKVNGRTVKTRIPSDSIPSEMNEVQEAFVHETGIHGQLKPSLRNKFKRITLIQKNKSERVTLDFDIRFEWKDKEIELSDIVIAELKQSKADRNSTFYKLMKKNIIRPMKLSKYCIGMILTHDKENLKYNRFKKKLLFIKKIQKNVA